MAARLRVYRTGTASVSSRRRISSNDNQPERPLAATPMKRLSTVLDPAAAAKIAVARRTKPSAIPDHVHLVLTLDIRRALAGNSVPAPSGRSETSRRRSSTRPKSPRSAGADD
jgi:hypothetical protein